MFSAPVLVVQRRIYFDFALGKTLELSSSSEWNHTLLFPLIDCLHGSHIAGTQALRDLRTAPKEVFRSFQKHAPSLKHA